MTQEIHARFAVAPDPPEVAVEMVPAEGGGWQLRYELTTDGRDQAFQLRGPTCRAVHDELRNRLSSLLNTNVRLNMLGGVEIGLAVSGVGRLGLDIPLGAGALHIAFDEAVPTILELGSPAESVTLVPFRLTAQGCAYPHRDYFAFGVCGGVTGGAFFTTDPDPDVDDLAVDASVALDLTARFELSLAAIDRSLRRFHVLAALDVLLSIYRARLTRSDQELEVEGPGALRLGVGVGGYL